MCILTCFWVLRAPKSWSNYFFQPFSTFFVHFNPFSVISHLKSTKNVWKRTKKTFFFFSSKLVDMQKLVDSLKGYLEIVFFGWFFIIAMIFAYIKQHLLVQTTFISVLFNLSKLTVTLFRLGEGGIQDLQVFTIRQYIDSTTDKIFNSFVVVFQEFLRKQNSSLAQSNPHN